MYDYSKLETRVIPVYVASLIGCYIVRFRALVIRRRVDRNDAAANSASTGRLFLAPLTMFNSPASFLFLVWALGLSAAL